MKSQYNKMLRMRHTVTVLFIIVTLDNVKSASVVTEKETENTTLLELKIEDDNVTGNSSLETNSSTNLLIKEEFKMPSDGSVSLTYNVNNASVVTEKEIDNTTQPELEIGDDIVTGNSSLETNSSTKILIKEDIKTPSNASVSISSPVFNKEEIEKTEPVIEPKTELHNHNISSSSSDDDDGHSTREKRTAITETTGEDNKNDFDLDDFDLGNDYRYNYQHHDQDQNQENDQDNDRNIDQANDQAHDHDIWSMINGQDNEQDQNQDNDQDNDRNNDRNNDRKNDQNNDQANDQANDRNNDQSNDHDIWSMINGQDNDQDNDQNNDRNNDQNNYRNNDQANDQVDDHAIWSMINGQDNYQDNEQDQNQDNDQDNDRKNDQANDQAIDQTNAEENDRNNNQDNDLGNDEGEKTNGTELQIYSRGHRHRYNQSYSHRYSQRYGQKNRPRYQNYQDRYQRHYRDRYHQRYRDRNYQRYRDRYPHHHRHNEKPWKSYLKLPTGDFGYIKNHKELMKNFKCGKKSILLDLEPSDYEYKLMANEMQSTIQKHASLSFSKYNIRKIEKVVNGCLMRRYERRQQQILSEYNHLNELILFHGTYQVKALLANGFDERYASIDGMFGAGIYFAEHSSKSNQYAFGHGGQCDKHKDRHCKICERQMLICRVTLGKIYKVRHARRKLANPPPGFHSLEGVAANVTRGLKYNEYIVYRGEQAYPEYVITYKLKP